MTPEKSKIWTPVSPPNEARPIKLGLLEGQFEVPEDFTAPMPEFEVEFCDSSGALAVEEAARA